MKKITIVSPCYNEQETVEHCYDTIKSLFENELPSYEREHIFVDNCSEDSTVEILRAIAQNDSSVRIIVNSRNFGVFRSTFNALRHCTGDAILPMLPVDLQDPPECIPEFVKLWEQGYEVVAGARTEREEGKFLRLTRNTFYRVINALSDVELVPSVGEFQLLDRRVLDAVLLHKDNYPYIRGIIASVGFKRVIVPYVWKSRKAGISKHSFLAILDQALNAIFAFSRAPMRFASVAGMAIAVLSFLFAFFSILGFFLNLGAPPRGTTTIIVSIFFFSGIQLIFIGILGEYITSIQSQVRGGPSVVERELINFDKTD